MSFPIELSARFRIDKAFSREEKRNVLSLVKENLTRGEGFLERYPTGIDSHFGRSVHS
jgi:hypothetical protein